MLGNFCMFFFLLYFLSSADLFQNQLFQKILSGTLSECQAVWNQIRTDILSLLIWFQTICKGYHQTTKEVASKERVNPYPANSFSPESVVCFLRLLQYTQLPSRSLLNIQNGSLHFQNSEWLLYIRFWSRLQQIGLLRGCISDSLVFNVATPPPFYIITYGKISFVMRW